MIYKLPFLKVCVSLSDWWDLFELLQVENSWPQEINQKVISGMFLELFGLLESSAMVGIYHSNSMKYHPERRAWQNARRLGMELKKYNKKICREAIEGDPKKTTLSSFVAFESMEHGPMVQADLLMQTELPQVN